MSSFGGINTHMKHGVKNKIKQQRTFCFMFFIIENSTMLIYSIYSTQYKVLLKIWDLYYM